MRLNLKFNSWCIQQIVYISQFLAVDWAVIILSFSIVPFSSLWKPLLSTNSNVKFCSLPISDPFIWKTLMTLLPNPGVPLIRCHQLVSSAGVISWCHQLVSSAIVISWCHQLVPSAGVISWCHQPVSSAGVISWCHQLVSSAIAIN